MEIENQNKSDIGNNQVKSRQLAPKTGRRLAIRLVGVCFGDLVQGSSQLSLFDDTEKEARLLNAMDKIRNRFGKGAVGRGVGCENAGFGATFSALPIIFYLAVRRSKATSEARRKPHGVELTKKLKGQYAGYSTSQLQSIPESR